MVWKMHRIEIEDGTEDGQLSHLSIFNTDDEIDAMREIIIPKAFLDFMKDDEVLEACIVDRCKVLKESPLPDEE